MFDERPNLTPSTSAPRARAADRARLRLAATEPAHGAALDAASAPTLSGYYPPVTDAHDPRWVLAARVAEQLQGEVLGPERRDRLMKLGVMLGLSRFDTCLVIAIVQDQARRGVRPEHLAASSEPQLRMIARPDSFDSHSTPRARRWSVTVAWLAAIVIVEFVIVKMFF